MLNIIIPMAGLGSRFGCAGYSLPKPLLPVFGRPMIEVVVRNLSPKQPHRFIFICQRAHLLDYKLEYVLNDASPGCLIIPIDSITEGPACTVLLARIEIDNNDPLMIANCDQYVSVSIDNYLSRMTEENYDGFIMTMTASDAKWSYIGTGADLSVTHVVEKKVISSEATVGIYNFRRGRDFIKAAEQMIAANDRTNNEFYVAPVYNYMIRNDLRVGFMNIGEDRNGMYGLGVPEDLEYFNSLAELP